MAFNGKESFCLNPSNISDTDRNPFAIFFDSRRYSGSGCCGVVNSLNRVVWVKIYNCHLGGYKRTARHTIDFKDTTNLSAICCFAGGRRESWLRGKALHNSSIIPHRASRLFELSFVDNFPPSATSTSLPLLLALLSRSHSK